MSTRVQTALVSLALAFSVGLSALWAQAPEGEKKAADKAPPPAAQKPDPKVAMIELVVPPNATVFFGDQKMTQPGTRRMYQSPHLEPAKTYEYTIKVTWPQPGQQDYTTTHKLAVRAGQTSAIDFTPLAPGMIRETMPGRPMPRSRTAPPRVFRSYEGSGAR